MKTLQRSRLLEERDFFRIRPDLAALRKILKALGNPQDLVPAIHVAGTNGKGSVAASMASILSKAGYRVGVYTSPHLKDVTERIRIGTRFISRSDLSELERDVMECELASGTELTYFEFTTAAAFLAFARARCPIAVVECGMGGLWDATNIIRSPLISVITSIGIDHAQWLGKHESEIAEQKAGILKPGRPAVSGVRGIGKAVIARLARERHVPLEQIDDDFRVERRSSLWTEGRQMIRYQALPGEPPEDFVFGLLGAHQADNAALAITMARRLESQGWEIGDSALRRGLRDVAWPGRFQVIVAKGRTVLLDGAHNPAAMSRFCRTLQESSWRNLRKHVVFGAFKDKDVAMMARQIGLVAADIHLAPLGGERGLSLSGLRRAFRTFKRSIHSYPSPEAAFEGAFRMSDPGDLVAVTGSLSLVGRLLPKAQFAHVRSGDHV